MKQSNVYDYNSTRKTLKFESTSLQQENESDFAGGHFNKLSKEHRDQVSMNS